MRYQASVNAAEKNKNISSTLSNAEILIVISF